MKEKEKQKEEKIIVNDLFSVLKEKEKQKEEKIIVSDLFSVLQQKDKQKEEKINTAEKDVGKTDGKYLSAKQNDDGSVELVETCVDKGVLSNTIRTKEKDREKEKENFNEREKVINDEEKCKEKEIKRTENTTPEPTKRKIPPPPPPITNNNFKPPQTTTDKNFKKSLFNLRTKTVTTFKSILDPKLVANNNINNEKLEQLSADIKSDKEERLNSTHRSCECRGGVMLWQKGRGDGEAYLSNQTVKHPTYTILQPIKEGEERDWPIQGNITMVVGGVEMCRAPGGRLNGEVGKTNTVFLALEKESETPYTHAYLDSGANTHMFKKQNVFESIESKQAKLQTACENNYENMNQARVGKTKALKYKTHVLAIEKDSEAVFCEKLVENLVSVGKICDQEHTIVFDKHGYVIFKGEVSARGIDIHAQDRDLLTGLYPMDLTTKSDSRGCRADSKSSGATLGTLLKTKTHFCDLNEVREIFSPISLWAKNICIEKQNRLYTKEEKELDMPVPNGKFNGALARFYVKEGMTDIERWHNKLGHVGTKILKICNINGLKIPNTPFRCEHCIRGKMHSGNHSSKSTGRKTDLKAGEYIITDLQGPYVRNMHGEKYSQIFIDVASKKVWVVRLKKKKESDAAIQSVLADARARSRNKIRILRTDGDGIFGRSRKFQELKEKEGFIHERPAPYDHQQSAIIDRECRTLLEGVNTCLDQSGAPSNFWGDAADHFVFTRNTIPRVQVGNEDGVEGKSPNSVFENRKIDFNLKHLVAFGTQVTCFIPPERREGRKTPGQVRAYEGVVLGYAKDMQAYIVWDIKERKKREVSFFHSIIHEGFFPFRDKKIWSEEEKHLPSSFSPRLEDILTPDELTKYGYTEDEEKEILREYFSGEEKKTHTESSDELDSKHVEEGGPESTTSLEKTEKSDKIEREGKEHEEKEKARIYDEEKLFFAPWREKKIKHLNFWKNAMRDGLKIGELGEGAEEEKIDKEIEKEEISKTGKRSRIRKIAYQVSISASAGVPGIDEPTPATLGEAKRGRYWKGYQEAIESELTQLEKNQTWTYVDKRELEKGTNILRAKFVLDIKRGSKGEFIKFKARMVACGYTQIEGVDYFETYASVMNTKSFRILLAMYNHNKDMSLQHWDVKQAFVNAPLDEVVYVHQVKGFERPGTEGKVLKLQKALYGTKQAAHAWQTFLSKILVGEGGRRNLKDECVYIFNEGNAICIVGTHVDDLFPLCNTEGEKIRDRIFKKLQSKMEIDNRGEITYALDTCIEADREKGVLRISQEAYIQRMIKEFNLQNAHGKDTPAPTTEISESDIPTKKEDVESVAELPIRNAIGKLWWAALVSRPDIICALHKCAAWQNKPSHKLWTHIIWIMKYLKNTITHAIVYKREENVKSMFTAYCDASFATETKSRSRYGYLFFVLGSLVSWTSVHTTRVLTSSTEAECHSVVHTAKENTWIRDFVKELNLCRYDEPTIIYQDNKGTISLMKKGGNHKRSKHFTIEFDALRDYVREKEIEIKYMETHSMPADLLTKILSKQAFEKHRNFILQDGSKERNERIGKTKLLGDGGVKLAMR